jgi:hypothetical protein
VAFVKRKELWGMNFLKHWQKINMPRWRHMEEEWLKLSLGRQTPKLAYRTW